jgi:hypothetical protein
MNKQFHHDLKIGEAVELEVLKKIQTKYPRAYKIEGYFKDFDIYVPEIKNSVEVKYDYKSKETGNIVVELTFDGKPSAIFTTKADYWVFVLHDKYIWTTPDRIKKSIAIYGKDPSKFKGSGDSSYKLAWLIPIETIEETSKVIQHR